jgi:hypothetical protein
MPEPLWIYLMAFFMFYQEFDLFDHRRSVCRSFPRPLDTPAQRQLVWADTLGAGVARPIHGGGGLSDYGRYGRYGGGETLCTVVGGGRVGMVEQAWVPRGKGVVASPCRVQPLQGAALAGCSPCRVQPNSRQQSISLVKTRAIFVYETGNYWCDGLVPGFPCWPLN